MEKKNILLDVDEVICFAGFLDYANEFMNTNYEIDDIKTYFIDDTIIPQNKIKEYNKFLNSKNIYENAHILPNAIESIKKLNEYYNIIICSACINPYDVENSGKYFKDKYDFLIKTLPFLKPENFIFTNTKNIIKADIQIDDRVSNLVNDIPIKILFPSYHNKEIADEYLSSKNIIRAGKDWRTGWQNVLDILIKEK